MSTVRPNREGVEASVEPSRAQPPLRDDGERFDWPALITLVVVVVIAVAERRAHLVGHEAGLVAGFLLALGVVALCSTVWSLVQVVRSRREVA